MAGEYVIGSFGGFVSSQPRKEGFDKLGGFVSSQPRKKGFDELQNMSQGGITHLTSWMIGLLIMWLVGWLVGCGSRLKLVLASDFGTW